MKKLLTQKDVEERVASGDAPSKILAEAGILTPGARDYLRELSSGTARSSAATPPAAPSEPIVPDFEFHWTPGKDPSTPAEIQAFFHSKPIEDLKQRICDMGRRMWERGYTDGNGGNLTVRVGDNLVLCTATLVSKGFMRPEQVGLVDLEGRQLAGTYKRTSEVNTHIAIMKRQPKAKACCHAHPPHATAYAVAKVTPPTCLIPEAEVFLGVIGSAEYQTPGTPENAEAVGKVGVDHQAVLMENHGVITWGKDIEDAYWKMENTDAYCQTVLLASMLGKELTPITGKQAKDLIGIRKQLGMSDFRESWSECELCDNADFRPGFREPGGPASPPPDCGCDSGGGAALDPDAEKVVQIITERIYENLAKA